MTLRVAALVVATLLQATFRGSVELVAVDFIAATDDGRPVADVRADELTLTVDGKVRPIRELQFIRLAPDEPPARAGVPNDPARHVPSADVTLPFGTNRMGEIGRTVVFLLDDDSIRPGNERAAKAAAARFLDRLAPYDRVVLATAARVEVDLTTDHTRVRAALATVMGHGASLDTALVTGAGNPRAGAAMVWLRDFLDGLKTIDGPKTVIFVSAGVPTAPQEYQDIAKAAGAVSAQLYVIQPNDFAVDAGVRLPQGVMDFDGPLTHTYHDTLDGQLQGLQDLATVSGGEFFRLSGAADAVFERVLRQSSAYYLLGFAPEIGERNGKNHRIEIRIARPGVAIRARPDFTIPKLESKSAAAGPTLAQMLTETKAYREVPLRAAAYAMRGDGKEALKVVVLAESIDPAVSLADVSFGLIDMKTRRMVLAWPADASAASDRRSLSGGVVPPGTYRLRVVARSKDDLRGAAEYEFVAGLTPAGPLQLSDLMIGQGEPDGTFRPSLDFGGRAAATGFVEFYGTLPRGTAVSAMFELAPSVDAPALVSVPGAIVPTAHPDRWGARGAVPIGSYPPGDYVVRANVKVDGAIVGRAVRGLRKTR